MTVLANASRGVLLPSSLTAVRTARTELTGFLLSCGVDAAVIDDAVVIVSELVTNAVRHAAPRADGKLRMECTLAPPLLRLQVRDGGRRNGQPLHDQGAVGGRGLSIVAALADSWSLERADQETVVTANLSVD